MIRTRRFFRNRFGVSVMYDAVLFIVMVSVSGVILIPALQSNIASDSSVETHREHVADEVLNTYLVSRVDNFSYKICGNLIDDIAGMIGIDNSSDGLYGQITNWLLAREQHHKTYATLLAENLGCQFRLPISILGSNRFNIFTGDYDRQLKNVTINFFNTYLGDKYFFNLTAIWHPIKGVNFGGELYIGPSSPNINCHVARSTIIMPYQPVINFGDTHIEFTRYWLNNILFSSVLGNIPSFENFSIIISDFVNETPPLNNFKNASIAFKENISKLAMDFLTDGIKNDNNVTIFPGIVNAIISLGFEKFKTALYNFTQNCINSFIGEAFGSIDSVFAGLNSEISNPIANGITEKINETIQNMLQTTLGSIFESFNALEISIKENVSMMIKGYIQPYIEIFVDFIFEFISNYISTPIEDIIINFKDQLSIWLSERISINKAEIILTIWEVRG